MCMGPGARTPPASSRHASRGLRLPPGRARCGAPQTRPASVQSALRVSTRHSSCESTRAPRCKRFHGEHTTRGWYEGFACVPLRLSLQPIQVTTVRAGTGARRAETATQEATFTTKGSLAASYKEQKIPRGVPGSRDGRAAGREEISRWKSAREWAKRPKS